MSDTLIVRRAPLTLRVDVHCYPNGASTWEASKKLLILVVSSTICRPFNWSQLQLIPFFHFLSFFAVIWIILIQGLLRTLRRRITLGNLLVTDWLFCLISLWSLTCSPLWFGKFPPCCQVVRPLLANNLIGIVSLFSEGDWQQKKKKPFYPDLSFCSNWSENSWVQLIRSLIYKLTFG